SRAAAAAQPRFLDGLDDGGGRHGLRLFPRLVAAPLDPTLVGRRLGIAEVARQEHRLAGVRLVGEAHYRRPSPPSVRSAECGVRNLPSAECGMRNAEWQGESDRGSPPLRMTGARYTPHSAFRTPHLSVICTSSRAPGPCPA